MGVEEASWPVFKSEGSIERFREALRTDAPEREPVTLRDRDLARIDSLTSRLDAADSERRELLKDSRWVAVKVASLEKSLQIAVDVNESILESLESCLREIRESEDRLSPRLARLEAEALEFTSRIDQANQDLIATRLESQSSSSQSDERFAEILELIHQTQIYAQEANNRGEVAEQFVIDLRGVEATVSSLAELPRDVASVSNELASVSDGLASITERTEQVDTQLSSRLAELADGMVDLSQKAEKAPEIAGRVAEDAASLSDRLDGVAAEAAESQRAVADLTAELASAIEREREIEERLAREVRAVADGLGAVKTDVSAVSDEVAEVRGLVVASEERVLGEVSGVAGELSALKESSVQGTADLAEERAREIEERMRSEIGEVSDGLSMALSNVVVDLSALKESSAQGSEDVAQELEALAQRLREVRSAAESRETELGEVNERLTAEVSSVSDGLSAVVSDVSAVSGEVAAQGRRVELVEEQVRDVGELASEVALVSGGLADVRGQVGEIEERVRGEVSGVAGELSALKESSAADIERVVVDVRSAMEAAQNSKAVGSDAGELAAIVARLDELEMQADEIQSAVDPAQLEKLRNEVRESIESVGWLVEDILSVVTEESPKDEAVDDPGDRHRGRWEEHLRVQTELRDKRGATSEFGS